MQRLLALIRPRPYSLPDAHKDEGFSIISVVIAFSMFVAVLGPAAILLQQATTVSGNVQNQIVAANIATKQLELIRSQASYDFGSLVTNYLGTSAVTVPIGGVNFEVKQTLAWTPGSYSPGGCGTSANGNTTLQPVLSATTSVTWPSMLPSEPPTTEATTFTPPVGQYSATSGDISVQVLSATGSGQENIAVSATGPVGSNSTTTTSATDSNGCVFFPFLPAGTYQLSLTSPQGYNYVDPSGNPNPSTSLGVVIGQISTYQFYYDQAGTLTIPAPANGTTTPSNVGITLASSDLKGLGTILYEPSPASNSDGSITLPNLFPFPTGYEVWEGSCYTYQTGSTFPAVKESAVTAGQTSTASIAQYLAQIQVSYQGAAVAGATVSINVMDPSSTNAVPYNQSCPGNSSSSYNYPIISSTSTSPTPLNLPVGYLQFTASVNIGGTVYQGQYPPAGSNPPYVDTTNGVGGPIDIAVS